MTQLAIILGFKMKVFVTAKFVTGKKVRLPNENNFLIVTFEFLKNVSLFFISAFYSPEFANIIQKICVLLSKLFQSK